MDSEQALAEMRQTRERIDRKVDLLQERLARPRGRMRKVALIGAALASAVLTWTVVRRARQRRHA